MPVARQAVSVAEVSDYYCVPVARLAVSIAEMNECYAPVSVQNVSTGELDGYDAMQVVSTGELKGYCAMQVVSTAEAVWWPQGARILLSTARREKEENPEAVLKRKD